MSHTRHQTVPQAGRFVLTCLLFLWVCVPRSAAAISETSSNTVEGAVAAIENRFDDLGVVEASYAVVRGDQETVAGYGTATPDTPFVIASVSKSITALGILQLVDRGLVSLDAPVTDYIDWFTTADPTVSITVRQLLTHTSGLSTLDGVRDAFDPEVALEERVRSISRYDLVSQPGRAFHYSNLNYAVLGLVIEEVSGVGYGEYVGRQVFEPLGMDHSYTDFALAQANGLATGTITVFGFPVSVNQTAFPGSLPDGFLISTARDLARYIRFQMGDGTFEGRRLLSTESMTIMHEPAVETGGQPYLDHYAMGWHTGNIDGEALVAHDGNTFGYHADISMLPGLDSGVVVLVARSGMVVNHLDRGAVEALTDGTPEVGLSATLTWIALDAVLALLVLGSIVTVVRRRRRRRENPRRIPRPAPALVHIGVGALIAAAFTLFTASLTGGLDVISIRIFWGLAPDLLIVAVAIPSLLIASGIASLWERRGAHRSSTPIATYAAIAPIPGGSQKENAGNV